jgi:cytoskeletal protein CcmA (bactofilin family)
MQLTLRPSRNRLTRGIVLAIVCLLCLSLVGGVASAQSDRTGGTVTIASDETHDGDLEVTGGDVRIEGTVDGDLTVTGGSVFVPGNVTGDLTVTAGTANVSGDVGGAITATGGTIHVREGTTVGGPADLTGGTITIDGSIDGNTRLDGDSVTVGPTASIDGDLTYRADRAEIDDSATITGTVTEREDSGMGPFSDTSLPDVPDFVVTPLLGAYLFLANFLLGAILLLVAPSFSASVSDRGIDRPVVCGGVGLVSLFAAPIVLVMLFLSVIGIPLAFFASYNIIFAAWIGLVYGAFVVGTYTLSLFDRVHRWGALAVGLALVSIANALPYVGWVLVLFTLLGIGAIVRSLYDRHVRGKEDGEAPDHPDPAPPVNETR